MSDPRLATHMLVGALIRRVQDAGGFAMVLHRGDPVSGVILIQCMERGVSTGLFERIANMKGSYRLEPCGPPNDSDPTAVSEYIARRRGADPDIWLMELDVAQAERLAAQTLC